MTLLQDVNEPGDNVETSPGVFDIAYAEGRVMAAQRVLRVLFLVPGDLIHRPLLGGNLQEFVGKPPITDVLRQLRNRVSETLSDLDFVSSFTFDVASSEEDGATLRIYNLNLIVDDDEVTVPEVNI